MKPRFFSIEPGQTHTDTGPQATVVSNWQLNFIPRERSTGVLGYVLAETHLHCASGRFVIREGMYFACGSEAMHLGGGCGIAMEVHGHRPQFQIGGPLEDRGRLKYIDGCTDSLLVAPARFGDPCLNALYFPAGINQTMHTHPSLRAGIVVAGRGDCVTPDEITPLIQGMVFMIETDAEHYFRTPTDSGMIVVAYHPDSDFGPQDLDHPMINRTLVGGVPANQIEAIRTK